jgi:hypothetical protein
MPDESVTPEPRATAARLIALSNRPEFEAVLAAAYAQDAVWDLSTTGLGVGRRKRSGLQLERASETATIFRQRAGKVTELMLYWSRERALADLGLEE